MKTLNYGEIPADLTIKKSYKMRLGLSDFNIVRSIVNQGIDSHLEAVMTEQKGNEITILNSNSMKCFLRRCVESDNDDCMEFASFIMATLDYEWV